MFCLPISSFLPNPNPEPSEPAAVETQEQFKNEKAIVLLGDKQLSAKSWSKAFRTGRRGDSGAVLSRKAAVLLADKEFSAKSWFGAF